MTKAGMGYIVTETPLHCGVGQDIGVVDQPIQRERHTGYPIVYGSEIKGVLRDHCKGMEGIEKAFGPEPGKTGDTDSYAAALSFGEAHVLFFPVRSVKGVRAWVTAPGALAKYQRSMERMGIDINIQCNVNGITVLLPDNSNHTYLANELANKACVVNNEITVLCGSDQLVVQENRIILEDHVFKYRKDTCLQEVVRSLNVLLPANSKHAYLANELANKACVVNDEYFKWFVQTGTEIVTRVRIDPNTGVVARGALWTEEYVPTDTFLYFPVIDKDDNGRYMKSVKAEISKQPYLHIGGNETVGKGFVRMALYTHNEQEAGH